MPPKGGKGGKGKPITNKVASKTSTCNDFIALCIFGVNASSLLSVPDFYWPVSFVAEAKAP